MKKANKTFVFIIILICSFYLTTFIKVDASGSILSEEEILDIMNTPVEITSGMYDVYTNSNFGNGGESFYQLNILNYNLEDFGFCGFNIDYIRKSSWLSNGEAKIKGDDPITLLVPKELFIHRGTYQYIGKDYGFFVKTTASELSDNLKTSNIVDVFIFDIDTKYENFVFSYEIKPIFTFTYFYFSEYVFHKNDKITINNINLKPASVDISDIIIPIPKMVNKYGNAFSQDYEATQPNKDLYAIKDTSVFLNLTNAHSKNVFDDNYNLDEDYGYRIRRSYAQFSGYETINPIVDYNNLKAIGIKAGIQILGMAVPDVGVSIMILDILSDTVNFMKSTKTGYEMTTLVNNPSDMDKGGKNEQREWYVNNGYDEQYWKFDIKKISSDVNNSLIFKTMSYDILDFPVYNSIKYSWHLESESNEETYLNYGSNIQIAQIDEKNKICFQVSASSFNDGMIIGDSKRKELSILSKNTGYVLKTGKDDVFYFTPEYSSYYKIETSENSTIKLYENDILVMTGYTYLEYLFDYNNEYKIIVELGSIEKPSAIYNISITPVFISKKGETKLNDYISENSQESILKIFSFQNTLYDIEIYSITNNTKAFSNFEVYDCNMNIIQKYDIDNYFNDSVLYNQSNMTIYLKGGSNYYIRFDVYPNVDMYLKYNEVEEEYQLATEYSFNADVGDKFSYVRIPWNGKYKINYNFSTEKNVTNNMSFLLFMYRNNELTLKSFDVCSILNKVVEFEIDLLKGDKIYFGYFNGDNHFKYNFIINYKPSITFLITTETDSATIDTGLGTEITVNQGLRYDNTIAVGFTRVLYLGEGANFGSRYNDYTWSSSNPAIATVSAYGTVFAKRPGNVIIRAIDKYGNNNIAIIKLEIYDQNTQQKNVELSTDINSDASLNGTEVKFNNGVPNGKTIHIGYTRSICIISGGPTNIRQDYYWYSSNNEVAEVNIFGIVLAKSKGTTVITCVNKYNPKYIGEITITVI